MVLKLQRHECVWTPMPPRRKVILHFQDENGTLSGMFAHFDEESHFCTGCPDWNDVKNEEITNTSLHQ